MWSFILEMKVVVAVALTLKQLCGIKNVTFTVVWVFSWFPSELPSSCWKCAVPVCYCFAGCYCFLSGWVDNFWLCVQVGYRHNKWCHCCSAGGLVCCLLFPKPLFCWLSFPWLLFLWKKPVWVYGLFPFVSPLLVWCCSLLLFLSPLVLATAFPL